MIRTGQSTTINVGGHTMVLRELTAQDAAQVVALHREVFGSAVDQAWYDWKYVRGAGVATGIWVDGQLIAHCGGIPRHFLHACRPSRDLQIGDVMVSPQWRGLLTRHGPFFYVSERLYSSQIGADRTFGAGFGFPSDRHLRLGMKTGLLREGGDMLELQWDTVNGEERGSALPWWAWRVEKVAPESAMFDTIINRAWTRMREQAQGFSIGERSAAYVHWRFAEQPGIKPVFLQLRRPWLRQCEGVAVISPATSTQTQMRWLDWIGTLDALPLARQMCSHLAAQLRAPCLVAWASPTVLEHLGPVGLSRRSAAARLGIPAPSDVTQQTLAERKWWLMGGDTDFL